MAFGNKIVVIGHGEYDEGNVAAGETHYPGMIVQRDNSVAAVAGASTFKLFSRGTDGKRPSGAFWVVDMDAKQGRIATTPYTAGERAQYYCPENGDQLNLLLKNLTGTGDDHALGERLIVDDATGLLIPTTGSPETEVAVLREAVTDPTADTLAYCEWGAY